MFEERMALLAAHFTLLPLSEAVERLARGALPARAVCVTFDDGYADNYAIAAPILRRHGVCATFFVAARYLDGGRMWNDTVIEAVRGATGPSLELSGLGLGIYPVGSMEARRRTMHTLLASIKRRPPPEREEIAEGIRSAAGATMPTGLMMTTKQVRMLRAAGMEIGGHTLSHPILTRLSTAEATREMADGKAELERIIGEPVGLFAYPNGKPGEDFTSEHVALARRVGFRAAVTTAWGAARRASDLLQLPRFTPWDRHPTKFALRLILNTRRPSQEV
jgi:peptidoglycan/xylan/chitin deacetylase (PgdA/CDA1 family)